MPEEDLPTAVEPAEVPPTTIRQSLDLMSVATFGLFIFASLWAIRMAKPILLPVMLALLLTLIFAPVHRVLMRLRLPPALGALVVLALLIGAVATAAITLPAQAAGWFERLPQDLQRVEMRAREALRPVERIQEVAKEVERATENRDERAQRVEVSSGSITSTIFENLQAGVATAAAVFILFFFLLAYRDAFFAKLVNEPGTVSLLRDVSENVSAYLLTISAINGTLGMAVAIAMYLLGMPNPALWGMMAALFNFVPYLGALSGVVIIGVVSLLTFDGPEAAIAPVVYFALTSLEGSFITPMILGKRFTVNPVVIFVWLLFWAWLWGIPGALLAVPLLMAFKIACDHVPRLQRVGRLISL
jgi:predicted PurR-regulated permease PerM